MTARHTRYWSGWLHRGWMALLQVKLGASEGSFVVDAYPVSIQATDLLLTFLTVLLVGLVAVWLPVRRMTRNLMEN